MKKGTLLFVFLIYGSILIAQQWVRQHPFPVLSDLQDIYMDDLEFGWTVGTNGTILYTNDNGQLWRIQDSGHADWDFNAIGYVPASDGQKAFAAGKGLLFTLDGGNSWNEQTIDMTNIQELQVIDANHLFLLSEDKFARSVNGGASWEVSDGLRNAKHGVMSFIDANNGWMSSSDEDKIYKTTDGGKNWALAFSDASFSLSSINTLLFVNETDGYLSVGQKFYKTTDGGANWTLVATLLSNIWTDLWTRNQTDIYACTSIGSVHISHNGGLSWTKSSATAHPARRFGALFQKANGEIWTVGRFTSILQSTDDGDNWADQITGSKGFLRSLSMYDDELGLASGYSNALLRTTDGGAVWEPICTPDKATSYYAGLVSSPSEMWVCGNGEVFKSTNGGTNWEVNFSNSFANTAITKLEDGTLLFCNAKRIVYRSEDNGDNWQIVYDDSGTVGQVNAMQFADNNTGYIVGYNGLLLKTTDGGRNWNALSTPDNPTINLITLHFVTPNEGWISGTRDYFYHTSDGGQSWNKQTIPASTASSIYFKDNQTGWIGSSSGQTKGFLHKTTNGGASWVLDYETDGPGIQLTTPINGNSNKMWIYGNGGNIEVNAGCATDPQISNLRGPLDLCQGDTVNYEVSFANTVLFNWSVPSDWVIIGNSNSSIIKVLIGKQAGSVSITGSNTCESTAPLSLTTTVKENFDLVDIRQSNRLLSTTTIADTYQWYLNNSPIAGATQNNYTATSSGNYYVSAQQTPCPAVASETITLTITSAIDISKSHWTIYPNPSRDLLWISTNQPSNESFRIQLFNSQGAMIFSQERPIRQQQAISVSAYASGIYFLQLTTTDHQAYFSKVLIVD